VLLFTSADKCIILNRLILNHIQSNLSKPNPFRTEQFVQFRQVFGLDRFKLHRHLVDGAVKAVWFRTVFGLFRVRLLQVSSCISFRIPTNSEASIQYCVMVCLLCWCTRVVSTDMSITGYCFHNNVTHLLLLCLCSKVNSVLLDFYMKDRDSEFS